MHYSAMSQAMIDGCCQFLNSHGIKFERFDHPAVFTVEQGRNLLAHIPGAGTKNLFLRNKSARNYFLITVPEEKAVDLKSLAETLGVGRLSFGSPEKLRQYLGVEPGSVTLLGLINDRDKHVQFLVDQQLLAFDIWQMHPLVNQATLLLHKEAVRRFVEITGHSWNAIKIDKLAGADTL